jgi:hypothetical protein
VSGRAGRGGAGMNALPAFGPALRKHLLQQLDQSIEAHRATLHPEDAEMAPLELRSWMKACDSRWNQETLEFGARRAIHILRDRSSSSSHFVEMRTPHAIYAVAALRERFGIDFTADLNAALGHGAPA